jgi:O-acetyl-ADP-ribose deacetylase (regulator of RNase III)
MSEELRITLADYNDDLVAEWKKATHYDFHHGDIFELSGDAIVSPANSFGFMDGGIDLVYVHRFGKRVEKALQDKIKGLPFQELLVGQAVTVPTGDEKFPHMISAPTMRVPMQITDPNAVRLAMRAAVWQAELQGLDSIVTPGLGTLTGMMRPDWAVAMMLAGIDDALYQPPFPSSVREAVDRTVAAYVKA